MKTWLGPLCPADSMMQTRTAFSGMCSITDIWVFKFFFSLHYELDKSISQTNFKCGNTWELLPDL